MLVSIRWQGVISRSRWPIAVTLLASAIAVDSNSRDVALCQFGSSASEAVGESIVAERPAWIVYCGPTACSSWDCCDEQQCPHEPRQIAIVNEASKQCGSYLTLISTDAVFHGPRLFHRETFPKSLDRPAAIAAIEAEKAITADGALIVRTHVFGWSHTATSFAERLWASLTEERPVALVWHSICHAHLGKRFGRIALARVS